MSQQTPPMRKKHRRLVDCLVAASCALAASAWAQRAWPTVALPEDARPFAIGDELGVNGMPTRIRGFLSARPVGDVTRAMRAGLGGAVVESHRGEKVILGQPRGDFYVTVQLEAVQGGTRALVSTTDLKASAQQREQTQADTRRWLQRLPAGSRVLSQVGARDGERFSSQLIYSNGASDAVNGEALKSLMQEDGLRFEREAEVPAKAESPGARVLLFKGPAKEATAVIGRLADGSASIVLNTVTTMQRIR